MLSARLTIMKLTKIGAYSVLTFRLATEDRLSMQQALDLIPEMARPKRYRTPDPQIRSLMLFRRGSEA